METAANDLQASSREQGRRDVVFVGRRGTVAKRLGETLKGRSFRLVFRADDARRPLLERLARTLKARPLA